MESKSTAAAGVSISGPLIQVDLIAAWPERVWRQTLVLPQGSTAAEALRIGRVMEQFPELNTAQGPRVGIFGRECSLEHVLQAGERLEIYRPLVFDPMESRRRRAEHRKRRGERGVRNT